MAEDCIFCRIVAGEIPASLVYEDDSVIAFRDIHPQAPIHLLVVPRQHIAMLSDLTETHADLAASMLTAVPRVARQVGGLEQGFRVIVNNGAAAGQTVAHLHLHILGGRQFSEGMIPR